MDGLPSVQTAATSEADALNLIREAQLPDSPQLVPTSNAAHEELSQKTGLVPGAEVTIAPDDTGRDDPTIGTLVALSPEEVVIRPKKLGGTASIDTYVHFPRLGFVVRPMTKPSAKL